MDQREWEDLNIDCLVEIFKRVGMESLLLDVPLVCKSWYRATLEPKCWESLIFSDIRCSQYSPRPITRHFVHEYGLLWPDFPSASLVQFVVNRSHRSATKLILPGTISSQALEFISNECPELKFLGLSLDLLYHNGPVIAKLICRWNNLEVLRVGNCYFLNEIFLQIQLHCKKFVGLIFYSSWIGDEEASAISSLPKLKYLTFRKAHLQWHNLLMILESCRELELLELLGCKGFNYDDEIRSLASHIRTLGVKCPIKDYDGYHYNIEEEESSLVCDRSFYMEH